MTPRGPGPLTALPLPKGVLLASFLIVNIAPLFGVLLGHWSPFELLFLYWVETGILCLLQLAKICLVCGWGYWRIPVFFCMIAGFFMAAHLFLLLFLCGSDGWLDLNGGFLVVLLPILAGHGHHFLFGFLTPWRSGLLKIPLPELESPRFGKVELAKDEAGLITEVFPRIYVIHGTVLAGWALKYYLGMGDGMLPWLVFIKMGFELGILLKPPKIGPDPAEKPIP